MDRPLPRSPRRATVTAAVVCLGWHIVVLCWVLHLLSVPRPVPDRPRCVGELFGCSEGTVEALLLLAVVLGPFAWLTSLLVTSVLAVRWSRHGPDAGLPAAVRATIVALGGLGTVFVAGVLVVVSTRS